MSDSGLVAGLHPVMVQAEKLGFDLSVSDPSHVGNPVQNFSLRRPASSRMVDLQRTGIIPVAHSAPTSQRLDGPFSLHAVPPTTTVPGQFLHALRVLLSPLLNPVEVAQILAARAHPRVWREVGHRLHLTADAACFRLIHVLNISGSGRRTETMIDD